MGFKRTRKQRKIRGGSRSQVISNYWGTCRFEKGRKKTRCLLDKQRGFWDAHGFKGKVYHIYEDKAAKEAFLQNVRESNKKRISDYLDANSNENDRFIYRNDPLNDTSDDTEEFKKSLFEAPNDYLSLTANDERLKKAANDANYERHMKRVMSDKHEKKTRHGTSQRLSPIEEESYHTGYYLLSSKEKSKIRKAQAKSRRAARNSSA
jgi:hypothetical protein